MPARTLPTQRNPLVTSAIDDDYMKELIARRRLGQTDLDVDNGKVGTSNSTRPENLGVFDYAHIRVPLPKNLKGSGIFHVARGSTPDAYFLMRRSSDGFVSATGMFKIAFPWSQEEEEHAEKAHIKKLASVSKDEVAGNIWIHPQAALELADEYEIRDWVEVLLHPTPIMSDSNKTIKAPPTFKATPALAVTTSPKASSQRSRAKTPTLSNGTILTPASETGTSPKQQKSPRKRAQRSASPTKIPGPSESEAKTPARKIATPKRPTTTKRGRTAAGSASAEPEDAPAAKPRKASGKKAKAAADEDKVVVKIDKTSEADATAGTEETTTKVAVETPARHPSLKLPDDAQGYLDSARKAIDEANKLTSARKETVRSRKRKVADISASAGDDAGEGASSSAQQRLASLDDEVPAAKKARLAEVETRREKIKKRAGLGIAASLATAVLVPFLSNYFGS